jgi:hypothetical protein
MPFYESVHCGIIRVKLNEQFVWQVLKKRDITNFKTSHVKKIANVVEDAVNCYTGGNLNIEELIIESYYNIVK